MWSHENLASWVTREYLFSQRMRLRGNTYLRLHENRWTESEEQFIEQDDWDACVHYDHFPLLPNKDISIMVGVDASVKNDSSAVVAVTKRDNEIVLVQYRKWQPSQKNPMDFEESIEAYIKELNDWYTIKEVRYDPFQFHRSAMTLAKAHISMVEFPQTVDRLTQMGQCLYQLIKGKNLVLYEDAEMRAHALKCVAQETPRGWRIVKKSMNHKIDIIIALAIACFAAVDMSTSKREWIRIDTPDEVLDKEEQENYEDDDLWEPVSLETSMRRL
jgi:phage terminase large subunit-like protein